MFGQLGNGLVKGFDWTYKYYKWLLKNTPDDPNLEPIRVWVQELEGLRVLGQKVVKGGKVTDLLIAALVAQDPFAGSRDAVKVLIGK